LGTSGGTLGDTNFIAADLIAAAVTSVLALLSNNNIHIAAAQDTYNHALDAAIDAGVGDNVINAVQNAVKHPEIGTIIASNVAKDAANNANDYAAVYVNTFVAEMNK